jgi:hypothetical protein
MKALAQFHFMTCFLSPLHVQALLIHLPHNVLCKESSYYSCLQRSMYFGRITTARYGMLLIAKPLPCLSGTLHTTHHYIYKLSRTDYSQIPKAVKIRYSDILYIVGGNSK